MKGIDQRTAKIRGDLIGSSKGESEPKHHLMPMNSDFGQLTGIKIEHKDDVEIEGNASSHGDMW